MTTANTQFTRHWRRRLAGALAVVGIALVGLVAAGSNATGSTNDDNANPTEAYCLYDAILFDAAAGGRVITGGDEYAITGGTMHPRVDVNDQPSDNEPLCGDIETTTNTAFPTPVGFSVAEAVLDVDATTPQLFMRATSSWGAEVQGTLDGVATSGGGYVFSGTLFDEDDGSMAMELVDYELIAV